MVSCLWVLLASTEVGVGGSSEEAGCCNCSEEPKLKASEDVIVSATTRFLARSSEEVFIELDSDSVAGVCITGASSEVLLGVSCTEVPTYIYVII
jgi:hypothetical protein